MINKSTEIGTVSQFEKHFGVSALDWISPLYELVCSGDCLCCLDLARFFIEHKELKFEYNGDWWEE